MHGEEMARRRDPESLYTAVAGISELTRQLAALQLGPATASPHEPPALPPEVAAELDALRKQVADLQASAHPSPAGDGDSKEEPPADPEKPAPRRKTAAAKAAAAE
jgi:hypothetical protein